MGIEELIKLSRRELYEFLEPLPEFEINFVFKKKIREERKRILERRGKAIPLYITIVINSTR
jgi:hypothetical protein